jgi:hypothetical protein
LKETFDDIIQWEWVKNESKSFRRVGVCEQQDTFVIWLVKYGFFLLVEFSIYHFII